jgi:hypothetical protein
MYEPAKASARASVISSKHHDQRGTPRYLGQFIILVSANQRASVDPMGTGGESRRWE